MFSVFYEGNFANKRCLDILQPLYTSLKDTSGYNKQEAHVVSEIISPG